MTFTRGSILKGGTAGEGAVALGYGAGYRAPPTQVEGDDGGAVPGRMSPSATGRRSIATRRC